MYVIKLKNIILTIAVLLAIVFFACNKVIIGDKRVETIANNYTNIIVIDAGHGLPDGGACVGDICEANINLEIAKKIEEELTNRGYDVIMTRENEYCIGDKEKHNSLSQTKASDLNNRVKIINESNADICVSIHLNKFDNSKYWGWQTFYNEKSEQGKRLAKLIQENITEVIKKDNKRTELKIDGIKIVDKTNIPVVIVECGFLSNPSEMVLLQTEDYQIKLTEGICNGIEAFYE